jgi:putative polyketide hydroxylase
VPHRPSLPFLLLSDTFSVGRVHHLASQIPTLAKVIAWKRLSLSALLTTYDIERRPVGYLAAEESAAAADEQAMLNLSKRAALLSAVQRIPRLLGYGYEYASQAIVSDNTSAKSLLWQLLSGTLGLDGRPGTRAPHIWVEYRGKRISTLDLFSKGFVLLVGSDGDAWCKAASTVAARLEIDLLAYRIGPTGDLLDSKNRWKSRSGISA